MACGTPGGLTPLLGSGVMVFCRAAGSARREQRSKRALSTGACLPMVRQAWQDYAATRQTPPDERERAIWVHRASPRRAPRDSTDDRRARALARSAALRLWYSTPQGPRRTGRPGRTSPTARIPTACRMPRLGVAFACTGASNGRALECSRLRSAGSCSRCCRRRLARSLAQRSRPDADSERCSRFGWLTPRKVECTSATPKQAEHGSCR